MTSLKYYRVIILSLKSFIESVLERNFKRKNYVFGQRAAPLLFGIRSQPKLSLAAIHHIRGSPVS